MAIDIGRIVVDGISDINYVTDFSVEVKPNEHAVCNITAILNNDNNYAEIEDRIVTLKDRQSETIIFKGYILSIETSGFQMDINLISCSIDLDLCKRKRSFQDADSTFGQIANRAANEDGGQVLYDGKADTCIGSALYQYEESDWEFIKRIAGMARSAVYPDTTKNMPVVYMDVSDRLNQSLTDVFESSEGSLSELGSNFQCSLKMIKVKCYTNLSVGAKVSYKDKQYGVISKQVYVEKCMILFEYILAAEEAVVLNQTVNYKSCGIVLKGVVKSVSKDSIKVDMDIDKKYGAFGEKNYLWKTITSNMLYCMPEKNASVIINLNDASGSEAVAIACMRRSTPPISANNKVFMVPSGKKIQLNAKETVFQNREDSKCNCKFSLYDTKDIKFDSTDKISLSSIMGDITVDSVNSNFVAPIQIKAVSTELSELVSAEFSMSTTVEISGKMVEICGSGRIEYPAFQDAPKDTGLAPKSLLKLALKVLLAAAVVALACVVAVALAPVTIAASTVVAGVIATCAIGGAALATVSVYSQYKEDQRNGIKRSPWDYVYMSVDKFCTGAILTAPLTIFPSGGIAGISKLGEFGLKMYGTARASALYQEYDSILDQIFNKDFYDQDSSFVGTMIYDVLCNGFGEMFAAGLGQIFKGADKLIKMKFPLLDVTNRTTARQFLRSSDGAAAMNQWRALLEKAIAAQEKYSVGSGFVDDTLKNLHSLLNNQFFNDADPLFETEEYREMEFKQYFRFESGELVTVD